MISADVGAGTDASTHYPGSQTTSSSATLSDDISDSTSTVMSDAAPKREIPQYTSSSVGGDEGSSPSLEGETQPLSSTPQQEEHSMARPLRPPLGLGNLQPCESLICAHCPIAIWVNPILLG